MKEEKHNELSAEAQLDELKSALQQSQRQFKSLIKNIPGIVYLCYYDEHWTMHYIVSEIEKISGYSASDFINNNIRSYASIIHPDDLELVERAVEKGITRNKAFEIEYRIIRKNGEIAWVYEKGQKVSSQDDKIWLSGIIFDITRQKQTAIALDIATEEWKVTFDAIPDGVLLLNRECRIMKCNRSAEVLLGKNEIVGQRCCEVIGGQDVPFDNCPCLWMLKSGHNKSIIRSIDKKKLEFTIVPITNPEGDTYGSVLLIVDVSKLKKAESLLKNREKQLKSIFHTAPIGIGVVSERKIIQVNEQICKLSGYSAKELIGKDSRILHVSDDEYKRVGAGYEHLKANEIATLQTYLKRKDGKKIKVSLNISALNTDINGFTFTVMPIE